MLGSIRKFSKSFLAKIFIAIIALPFILWGMGDVFTSGKQNVIAEINDEKISSKEFINYVQKIKITKNEINRVGKDRLFDDILTNYLSEKIIFLEGKKKGIMLSDQALKKILIADNSFKKDNKFSRTRYEKFLLKNGYTAPAYEGYVKNIELKGQLLNYYSGGIKLPDFVVEDLFRKENQIKEIQYFDLNSIYSKKMIDENEIKEFYEKNKELFNERFITFRFLELKPELFTKKKEFDERYYEKLDELENEILDGKEFDEIISNNKQSVRTFEMVNSRRTKSDGTIIQNLDKSLFQNIFLIKNTNLPEIINLNNKYFIAEIIEEKNMNLSLKDKDLRKTINLQLKISHKVTENKKIIEKIDKGNFDQKSFMEFSKKNNLVVSNIRLDGINDNKKFSENLVKKIYNYNKGDIFLLTDNLFKENFVLMIINEKSPQINKNSEKYLNYLKKANTEYISKVYKSYDKYINENYKIDINQKVLERLKNSF
tara:strand:+ start:2116 stop:3570 length:1455 start_codon:yes stop_codon:yes gene_type:complete